MRQLSRVCALLLAALLLLPAPARAADDGAFADVPKSHWAYENIRLAAERGLVNGMGPKTFGLGQSVTRAQYAAMLCRLMDWALLSPESGSFSDNQNKDEWYYSAVETAYAHGALLKLDDTVGANEPLPREEMAAMTVRALGFASLAGIVQDDCPFADVSTNRGYVALAYRMGFMGGVGEASFSPRTASTREQAATVLLRVYDRMRAEIACLPVESLTAGAAARAEPIVDTSGQTPLCPRAPLEHVYEASVRAGAGGAVVLLTQPYLTESKNGAILSDRIVSDEELSVLLALDSALVSRSARYGSSYLLLSEGDDTTAVWYETEDDIAEKVALCRMLGVQTVYLE